MSNATIKRTMMSLAIASACSGMAPQAMAQQAREVPVAAAAAATAAASGAGVATADQIAEVVVTATRHSTSLLKTPVSMTAVTQEDLTRQGITDVRGLSGQVPNLQLGNATDGSSGVKITIRGVSSNDFTEIGNPAVGLHVAGIYTARPQSALALLFDLDQVEVLRGPQGTLFGRNATGGSINIIPAKPEFNSKFGQAELALGNYNMRQLSVVQNIPVTDNFAMRATMMAVKRDSYLNQSQDFYAADFPALGIVPARDANGAIIPDVDQRHNVKVGRDKAYLNKDEWAGRLQARWKLDNNLEWRGTYERFSNQGAGDLALKDCKMAAGTAYACPGGQWDVKINLPGELDMTVDTVRTGLIWDWTANTSFEYNGSWTSQKRRQIRDGDSGYQPVESDINIFGGAVNDIQGFTTASKYNTIVHELQVRGAYDNFRYVGGLFWMHERNAIDFGDDQVSVFYDTVPYTSFYHQPNRQSDSKAIFGQADWQFAPKFNLTVGGRLTRDERTDTGGQFYDAYGTDGYFKGTFNPLTPRRYNSSDMLPGMGTYYGMQAFPANQQSAMSSDSDSWKKFTWRLGLSYQLSPTDFLFSSLSTGYKAGGFSDKQNICGKGVGGNCIGLPPGPHYTNMPWQPETVTNLEFGYKGRMLDNRLTLSATAFYSKYKDMQVTGSVQVGRIVTPAPCAPERPACDAVVLYGTSNAASANLWGIELEGKYKPWRGGQLSYSYSHLSARIDSYPTYTQTWRDVPCAPFREQYGVAPCVRYSGPDPLLVGKFPLDVTGNSLPNSPANTLRLEATQEFLLPREYMLTPRLAARWQDKMYFSIQNLDNARVGNQQEAYAIYDASIRLSPPSEKWHAELYVNNLSQVVAKNNARVYDLGYVLAQYNEPRMFGVRLRTQW
jgi:iron complex outermembrane receptor protein